MKQFRIYGASDDLIECEVYTFAQRGDGSLDETNADGFEWYFSADEDVSERRYLKLTSQSEGAIIVTVDYNHPNGCWSVGILPIGDLSGIDGAQFPKWPIAMVLNENGYSTELRISCPDDTKVLPVIWSEDTETYEKDGETA